MPIEPYERYTYDHFTGNEVYLGEGFNPSNLRSLCNAISNACHHGVEVELFDDDAPSKYAAMFFEPSAAQQVQTHISDALRLLVRTANSYIQPLITPPPSNTLSIDSYLHNSLYALSLERTESESSWGWGRRVNHSFGRGRGRGGGRYRGRGTDRGNHAYTRRDNIYPDPGHGATAGAISGETTELVRGEECARNDNRCSYFTCLKVHETDLPWYGQVPWKTYFVDGVKDATNEWLEQVTSVYPSSKLQVVEEREESEDGR